MSFLILNEQSSAPSTPAASKVTIYVDNTATPQMKFLDDAATARTVLDSGNTVTATGKTFTTPTLTTPLISTGLTASGSTSNDFSASTGTFKTSTGLNTIGGELDLVTGTNAIAPIKFTSGTNLTSATAGANEYDGNCFYSTPVASARGLSPSTMFSIVPAGDFNLLTTSGVQSAFPTTGDVWTLAGSTAYFFEGAYYITHTTTTCTVAMAFATSGSVTSIAYYVESVINAANGAPAAPVATWVNQIATTVVTATSTVGWAIKFKGILRMNAVGTITPQVNWSANTTAPVMKVDSHITFTPLGTNTTNILGNVA